jgi:Uma2 family endonuclease
MAQPASDPVLTGEELLALGDVGPCELIDGRIVRMTPTGAEHSRIEGALVRLIGNFADERRCGWVLAGEVGIYTRRNPDRIRGADLAFVARDQAATIPEGFLELAPELVVEIISPNDRWTDVRDKIDEYFAIGVERVWAVEPRSRQILVYTSPTQATPYRPGDRLRGTGSLEGLEIEVDRVFG